MRRFYFWMLFVLLFSVSAKGQFTDDITDHNYDLRTISMPSVGEERIVCTLIHKQAPDNLRQAVLYIHGYNDYFFQSELGDSLLSHGYNFYAIDLRRYGRSLLPGQDAFHCNTLDEYFADIDTALSIIRKEGNDRIFLMGHSTGGLISSYYLKHHPQAPVKGLILNSPFLDWNFGWFMENIAIPAVSFIGKYYPQWIVQGASDKISMYACSLLSAYFGEWSYNEHWKMTYSHHKRAGWIRAIHTAQQDIQRECNIGCPILLLSSDRSVTEENVWKDDYMSADIVLSVDDIQKYGIRLGKKVSAHKVEGGMHDLILSSCPVRKETYRLISEWLDQVNR